MVIDGLRVLEESLPPSGAAWKIKGPIYLGGVAPGRAVKNIQVRLASCGKTESLTLEPETTDPVSSFQSRKLAKVKGVCRRSIQAVP